MIFPFPREGRAGHGPDNLALEKVITTFRQGKGPWSGEDSHGVLYLKGLFMIP